MPEHVFQALVVLAGRVVVRKLRHDVVQQRRVLAGLEPHARRVVHDDEGEDQADGKRLRCSLNQVTRKQSTSHTIAAT